MEDACRALLMLLLLRFCPQLMTYLHVSDDATRSMCTAATVSAEQAQAIDMLESNGIFVVNVTVFGRMRGQLKRDGMMTCVERPGGWRRQLPIAV